MTGLVDYYCCSADDDVGIDAAAKEVELLIIELLVDVDAEAASMVLLATGSNH